MGILKAHMHILGMELSKESFISGNVLILSQQSVWNTLEGTKKIFKKYGLDLRDLEENFKIGNLIKSFKDQKKTREYINVYALMKLLGADTVSTIDVSSYENVDIIHDMSYPIKKEYHDKFDFIFDSGSLEHIFNFPQALENISKMLKVGGTFFLSVPSSNYIDHGFYSISPTLFFDYFEANGFN